MYKIGVEFNYTVQYNNRLVIPLCPVMPTKSNILALLCVQNFKLYCTNLYTCIFRLPVYSLYFKVDFYKHILTNQLYSLSKTSGMPSVNNVVNEEHI